MRRKLAITVLAVVLTLTGALGAFAFGGFGPWGVAEDIESFGAGAHENFNTPGNTEGCPFISPDGKMFFIASNRAGTLDIWVSTRVNETEQWGEPVRLGPPINTDEYADFCPTIGRDGKTFFFASNRPGFCGGADLFTTRLDSNLQATSVTHLGCVDQGGVNSSADEHSPFPAEMPGMGPVLFYSSARPANASDTLPDHDLYVSIMHGGRYGVGVPMEEINTREFQEGQPNVRRDGQELFFYSNRTGNNDIYSSAKNSPTGAWGTPENLGSDVNSPGQETRPSLSWDGTTLYFGSTRSGVQDVYVTTR